MKTITLSIIALLVSLHTTNASAIPEPALPAQVTIENITLNRCSIAPVKALVVFKVGYASLYALDCSRLTEAFYETTKQLSFEYYREIPGDAFGKAAANFLKKNLAPETWTLLEEKINAFNSHYRNVVAGDRYDMIYTPGEGLQLLLNNELLTTEADPVFARAYFEIWFGEEPYDGALKRRLLNP